MHALLTLALIAAAPTQPAGETGQTRTLTIVNDAGAPVNQLFVSGGKAKGWRAKVNGIVGATADERDRLDARMLPRGGSIALALAGPRCKYAVRAILEDGRTYAGPVDVCSRSRLTLSQLSR